MEVTMLKGKIHRVKVTQAEVDYVGSITIDPELMSAAGIFEYEKVAVVDVTNGARLETYTIAGEPGSGIICLNGAAAKLINKGDTAIIMAYAQMSPEEAAAFRPKVVFVDENKKIVSVKDYERHGVIA